MRAQGAFRSGWRRRFLEPGPDWMTASRVAESSRWRARKSLQLNQKLRRILDLTCCYPIFRRKWLMFWIYAYLNCRSNSLSKPPIWEQSNWRWGSTGLLPKLDTLRTYLDTGLHRRPYLLWIAFYWDFTELVRIGGNRKAAMATQTWHFGSKSWRRFLFCWDQSTSWRQIRRSLILLR